ncbi:MAG: anti-sigma factor [Geodermatophilaceae bacterium]
MDEWDERDGRAGLPDGVALVLGQRETWAEPPPEMEAAVRAALLRERADAGATSVDVSGIALERTDVSGGSGAARPPDDEMSAARDRRGRLLLVAAALMGVAAVGTAVVISQTGQDSTVVALTPTELAPDASGTAELSERPSGFSIELDIDGLPPAAEGSYYQAWLKNADGELVTIGTFHARDGSDDVILWSGVDPADYPTLTVTLQREGEGAQSSGQVVLTGSLG